MAATLKFHENGKFKIMIMGDPHESVTQRKDAKRKTADFLVFLNMALDAAEPDLVIFMGDNTAADDSDSLREKIQLITKPIRARNIPLGVILGNHDLEAGVSDMQEHICAFRAYENTLYPEDARISPWGDYQVTIRAHDDSKDIVNLWLLYSGAYAPEEYHSKYAFVTDGQIRWYEKRAAALREQNGGEPLPAMVFQHIPVPEEWELLKQVSPLRYAFEGVCAEFDGKKKYFVLDRAKGVRGNMGEVPCPPSYNNGQFDAWLRVGDVFAAFFGHDHLNDFIGEVRGITLAQCKMSGFRQYGDGMAQAMRIVELDENAPRSFHTYMLPYREVVGNYCQSIHGWERVVPDRVSIRVETALKIAAGVAAVGSAGSAIAKFISAHKRKKG